MKIKMIGYWTSTILLLSGVLSGGIAELVQRQENIAGIVLLGYSPYVVTLLGFWKVLGSIVLLIPRFPRLKEWAYAGIFFNMTGAAVSHIVCGSNIFHIIVTSCFALLTIASWRLRPESRMLGAWKNVLKLS